MIELNEQQRQELKNPEPRARDPETGETYVLVRADTYERLKGVLGDEDWSEGAYREAMEVFARDGWDDPRMDVYERLPRLHDAERIDPSFYEFNPPQSEADQP